MKKILFEQQAVENTGDLLTKLFGRVDRLLVKKLSNNDRDWAYNSGKHQAGVYIPHEQRDGGFFPTLKAKLRSEGAAEIRETHFDTVWPQFGNQKRSTRLVNYTSKGQETHMTGLPKEAFSELLPASFIIMGRLKGETNQFFECLTVDSGSDEALLLVELFDIGPDFLIGEYDPSALKAHERDRILDFADQVISAWLKGNIADFALANAAMPDTTRLAAMARQAFMNKYELEVINPFAMDAPGDALREISRSIEWDLFREYQRRERAVEVVRLLLGDEARECGPKEFIRRLVNELPSIDAIMLSASQQRKSRAGYSYEHHIEAMLSGGQIPYEKQVVIEAKKRPDFILPSLKFVDGGSKHAGTGLILSAKTTLREHWNHVEREKGTRNLFLTTVDENVAGNAIDDMASMGVHLVIPESLMNSKATEYAGHDNVLTFRDFCEKIVKPNLDLWQQKPD